MEERGGQHKAEQLRACDIEEKVKAYNAEYAELARTLEDEQRKAERGRRELGRLPAAPPVCENAG